MSKEEYTGLFVAMQSVADPAGTMFATMIRRFGRVEGRRDRIDGRLDGIDGRLDGMDGSLARVERRLTNLEDTVACGFRDLGVRVGVLEKAFS
jgi:hypothetical protein